MTRLPITSFNNSPGNAFDANMGEAALFKMHGLASRLITRDRTDELWDTIPVELTEIAAKKQWGIRQVVYPDGIRMFGFPVPGRIGSSPVIV